MIKLACQEADLEPPNQNTVYARAYAIDQREMLSKRYSPRLAREKLEPLRGQFPGADYPYAVVQIDHTKVDVVIVDEAHRLPIGRPYLTVALDVATKMISGFLMTLDPPSSLSAGLCVAHAVMRKEHWLAKRDIVAEWPVYGKMSKIHVDNAKEFHGKMLKRACEQHGIILEHRPKGQPNYGPHIERAFRTFMGECQSLPGTTFSNVQAKMNYDSEGRACMTLAELELWFTVFVAYCYHHRAHKGINEVPPIKLYHQFVHGTAERPGIGLPAPIEDEENFRLDFTPYVERTIQRHGVVIDNIHYTRADLAPLGRVRSPRHWQGTQVSVCARPARHQRGVFPGSGNPLLQPGAVSQQHPASHQLVGAARDAAAAEAGSGQPRRRRDDLPGDPPDARDRGRGCRKNPLGQATSRDGETQASHGGASQRLGRRACVCSAGAAPPGAANSR
ncbi:DDE-type integrase/transposase/recombinase [Chromobacterium haemolyticum]|nr:DDE-type integrase/transposase/recombinase [Chromobacterium haemolyticum]